MPYVVMPWLGEHVELPEDPTAEQLAADLVKVGLEEEAIHSSGITGPLVVGRVLEVSPEPQRNGKVINWCQLDTGERTEDGEVAARGVICGAHNFAPGDAVVVALPGAVLPGDFVIASRKTYGHVSNGMICSAEELGLGDDPRYAGDGIIVLATAAQLAQDPTAAPAPGSDALGLLGLADEVLEINVTPDRGYCFSVRGVAREYAHSTGARFTDPGLPAPAGSAPAAPEATPEAFAVEIDDDAPIRGAVGCDRFVTRIVRGVDPAAPSPAWLAERLRKAGMRPISLAVDATNYVMLDLGQPLHAYDLATVHEPIVVRRARPGERLVTLDDADRALDAEDLLITDSPDGGARSPPDRHRWRHGRCEHRGLGRDDGRARRGSALRPGHDRPLGAAAQAAQRGLAPVRAWRRPAAAGDRGAAGRRPPGHLRRRFGRRRPGRGRRCDDGSGTDRARSGGRLGARRGRVHRGRGARHAGRDRVRGPGDPQQRRGRLGHARAPRHAADLAPRPDRAGGPDRGGRAPARLRRGALGPAACGGGARSDP